MLTCNQIYGRARQTPTHAGTCQIGIGPTGTFFVAKMSKQNLAIDVGEVLAAHFSGDMCKLLQVQMTRLMCVILLKHLGNRLWAPVRTMLNFSLQMINHFGGAVGLHFDVIKHTEPIHKLLN